MWVVVDVVDVVEAVVVDAVVVDAALSAAVAVAVAAGADFAAAGSAAAGRDSLPAVSPAGPAGRKTHLLFLHTDT